MLGHLGSVNVVASACAGMVRLWEVAGGSELDAPDMGDDFVERIDLGTLAGQDVLVTGSRGGTVAIWNLATRGSLATLTLDGSIEGVWVVHGADMVAALTPDNQLHLFDLAAQV
jgi:WD40 repeat protein